MLRAILLLEDDMPFRLVLTEQLIELLPGPPLLSHAATLIEALPILRQEPIDLVIVDLALPDAQDLNAVHAVREAAPYTPILVLTGSPDLILKRRVEAMTACAWLSKGTHLRSEELIRLCYLLEHSAHLLHASQRISAGHQSEALAPLNGQLRLAEAKERASQWERYAMGLLTFCVMVLTGIAVTMHNDLKSKHEALVEKVRLIELEQARRTQLINRVDVHQQELARLETRLQLLDARLQFFEARQQPR